MELMVEFIDKKIDYLDEKGVRVNPIGVLEKINRLTYDLSLIHISARSLTAWASPALSSSTPCANLKAPALSSPNLWA